MMSARGMFSHLTSERHQRVIRSIGKHCAARHRFHTSSQWKSIERERQYITFARTPSLTVNILVGEREREKNVYTSNISERQNDDERRECM